jgi:hypothetical protein
MSEPADPPDGYALREATIADAPVLARQRRLMFDSISPMSAEQGTLLEAAILRYIAQAMPAGTFRSWVIEHQGAIVSGGGLQLRTLMPRPGYVYPSTADAASVARSSRRSWPGAARTASAASPSTPPTTAAPSTSCTASTRRTRCA